jgi:uncharacterized protein (DUF433 family)
VAPRFNLDSNIGGDAPTSWGLLMTTSFILKLAPDNHRTDDVIAEYPELEKEEIRQALKYAAKHMGERGKPFTG